MAFRGAWQSGDSYDANDSCINEGMMYLCTSQINNSTEEPHDDTDLTNWRPLFTAEAITSVDLNLEEIPTDYSNTSTQTRVKSTHTFTNAQDGNRILKSEISSAGISWSNFTKTVDHPDGRSPQVTLNFTAGSHTPFPGSITEPGNYYILQSTSASGVNAIMIVSDASLNYWQFSLILTAGDDTSIINIGALTINILEYTLTNWGGSNSIGATISANNLNLFTWKKNDGTIMVQRLFENVGFDQIYTTTPLDRAITVSNFNGELSVQIAGWTHATFPDPIFEVHRLTGTAR